MLPSVLKSWRVPTLQIPIKAFKDGLQFASKDNLLTHIQRYLTSDLQAAAIPPSRSVSVRPKSDVSLRPPDYVYFWEKLKKCFGFGKKERKGKNKSGKKTKKQECKSGKGKCSKKKDTCLKKKDSSTCGVKPAEKPKVDCKPKADKKPTKADLCKKDEKKEPSKKKEEKKSDPCKKEVKKADPCKKKEEKKEDPCKKKEEKKEDPCKKKEDQKKEDPCKKKEDPCIKKEDTRKKKEDPCKKKEEKKKDDPCKKKDDPCKKKDDKKKEDPCKKKEDQKKDDPCKKKEDPCMKKEDPCKKKEDPCKKKEEKKKDDPCKKKDDPCKKKDDKTKEDPCNKKDDPCKKNDEKKKDDPCKKKEDPCKKKEDPCKKKEDPCKKKEDPCKKKEDPCKKKEDPCKKKEDPCKKREDPCKKKEDPCKKKDKKDDPCKKADACKTKVPCGDKCVSSESVAKGPILLFSGSNPALKKQEEMPETCKDPCAQGACDVLPGQDEPCGSSVSWKIKVNPCRQRSSASRKTKCPSPTACIVDADKKKGNAKIVKDSDCGLVPHPCGKKVCPNRCDVKKKFSSAHESSELGIFNFINVTGQAFDILSLAVNFASQRGTPGNPPPSRPPSRNPTVAPGNVPAPRTAAQKMSGIIGKIKGFWNGPEDAKPLTDKQHPKTTNMPINTPGRSTGRYPTRQRCEGLDTNSICLLENNSEHPELPTDSGFIFAVGPPQDDFEKCEDRKPPCPEEIETMPCPKQVETCEKTTDEIWSDIDASYGYEKFPFKKEQQTHGTPMEIASLRSDDPYANHRL